MTPLQEEADRWDACAYGCRIEIIYNGTYLKEKWYWAAHCPTGMLRDGCADAADEAAILAKYAICDYVDAVAGVPR